MRIKFNCILVVPFVSCLILVSGCKETKLVAGGVRNPRTETPSTINAYLRDSKLENEINLVPEFENLHSIILSGITPTTVYVFDRKGQQIKLPGESNKCTPEPSFFIKSLSAEKEYSTTDELVFDSLQNWLYTLKEEKINLKEETSDFYVLIFWAIWPGKMVFNRDIKSTIKVIKENSTAQIKLILVNLDKQSIWGEENLKKVKFTKNNMFVSLE